MLLLVDAWGRWVGWRGLGGSGLLCRGGLFGGRERGCSGGRGGWMGAGGGIVLRGAARLVGMLFERPLTR